MHASGIAIATARITAFFFLLEHKVTCLKTQKNHSSSRLASDLGPQSTDTSCPYQYCHLGSPGSSRAIARRLASRTGCKLFSIVREFLLVPANDLLPPNRMRRDDREGRTIMDIHASLSVPNFVVGQNWALPNQRWMFDWRKTLVTAQHPSMDMFTTKNIASR